MRYKTKVVEVDTIQWLGENLPDISLFIDGASATYELEGFVLLATLYGTFRVEFGDYIIKDANGVLSVMTPQPFWDAYEPVPGSW